VSRLASSSISKFERAWSPAYGGGSENFAEAQRATLGRASGAARDKARQDPLKDFNCNNIHTLL